MKKLTFKEYKKDTSFILITSSKDKEIVKNWFRKYKHKAASTFLKSGVFYGYTLVAGQLTASTADRTIYSVHQLVIPWEYNVDDFVTAEGVCLQITKLMDEGYYDVVIVDSFGSYVGKSEYAYPNEELTPFTPEVKPPQFEGEAIKVGDFFIVKSHLVVKVTEISGSLVKCVFVNKYGEDGDISTYDWVQSDFIGRYMPLPPVKMTMKQVIKELGYPIEIISEGE